VINVKEYLTSLRNKKNAHENMWILFSLSNCFKVGNSVVRPEFFKCFY
jgi:hypothetical protein